MDFLRIHDLRLLAMEATKKIAHIGRDALGVKNSFKISVLIVWSQLVYTAEYQLEFLALC